MRAKILATIAGTALALTATAPATAAPWDGQDFDFGYGQDWEFNNFNLDDVNYAPTVVDFTQPASNGNVGTDIWDGSLEMAVNSSTAGVDEPYSCNQDSDIDIAMDGDDLVIKCTTAWDAPTNSDVDIRGNIRLYGPDADLVRYVLEITNNSNADITDFYVMTMTDFGSSGDIWGYQNEDPAVLAVPASESDDNSEAINSTGSYWLVNYDGSDPSGSLAWGNENGSVLTELSETSSDIMYTTTEEFTVPAGETVYLAYFLGWDPEHLSTVTYNDDQRFANDAEVEANGDAVVAKAQEFNTFSGRLVTGLEDANVVNWGPAPEEELADTGADTSSLWAGLGLLVAGVAVVAVRRRVRA